MCALPECIGGNIERSFICLTGVIYSVTWFQCIWLLSDWTWQKYRCAYDVILATGELFRCFFGAFLFRCNHTYLMLGTWNINIYLNGRLTSLHRCQIVKDFKCCRCVCNIDFLWSWKCFSRFYCYRLSFLKNILPIYFNGKMILWRQHLRNDFQFVLTSELGSHYIKVHTQINSHKVKVNYFNFSYHYFIPRCRIPVTLCFHCQPHSQL